MDKLREKLLFLIQEYTQLPPNCHDFVADFWLTDKHDRVSKLGYCPKMFNTILYFILTNQFTTEEVKILNKVLKKNLGRTLPTDHVSARKVERFLEYAERVPAAALGITAVWFHSGKISVESDEGKPVLDALDKADLLKQRDKSGVQASRFIISSFKASVESIFVTMLKFESVDWGVNEAIERSLKGESVTISEQIVAGYSLKLRSMKAYPQTQLSPAYRYTLASSFLPPTSFLLTALEEVATDFAR